MVGKAYKTLVSGVLVAASAFGLSACNLEPESAYDIAVKYGGFQGTQQEWLASLNGSNGKDAESPTIDDIYASWVQKEGNEGKTFNEFLNEYLSVEYNENNNTEQIAHNLASAVSIYCGFEKISNRTSTWGYSAGSGVIYSLDKEHGNGYVVTNYHVMYESGAVDAGNGDGIAGNENIFVYLYGTTGGDYLAEKSSGGFEDTSGEAVTASYVGGSMTYDVAILQIYGDNVSDGIAEAAQFAEDGVTAGEKVYAIGNASGKGISVSAGAVSVESEYIRMTAADKSTKVNFHVLRTDSAINPGNSGGGLFNAAGELVGIVNAKSSASSTDETTIENVGYALPASDVRAVVENILYNAQNGGKVYKPYFGITTQRVSSYSEWNETGDKLSVNDTLKVTAVNAGETKGLGYNVLKKDDKILSVRVIDGEGEDRVFVTLGRQSDFQNALLYVRPGDTVRIVVRRGLADKTLEFADIKASDFTDTDALSRGYLQRLQ